MKRDDQSIVRYAFSLLANKFAKIKSNRIVFTSLDGHYSDSPKYISEAMHRISPETEIVQDFFYRILVFPGEPEKREVKIGDISFRDVQRNTVEK